MVHLLIVVGQLELGDEVVDVMTSPFLDFRLAEYDWAWLSISWE